MTILQTFTCLFVTSATGSDLVCALHVTSWSFQSVMTSLIGSYISSRILCCRVDRYQRCYALTRPGGAYRQLMTGEDKQLLPTLAAFQSILQYKRITLPPNALQGQQLYDYYSGLINMYLGEEALFW